MTGLAAKDLVSGTRYLAIHYSADPAKATLEWIAKTKGEDKISEDDWQREMELNERIFPGEKVYKNYLSHFHCPDWSEGKDIQIKPHCHYVGQWDAGDTLSPAFLLKQLRPMGLHPITGEKEWRVYEMLEVVADGAEPMSVFAPKVKARLEEWSPEYAKAIIHVADPNIMQRTGARGETAHQVALEHGFNLIPMTNDWEARRSAVSDLLMHKLSDGKAGYIISAKNCPTLRKGFEGAYHLPKSPTHDQIGPGVVYRMPVKNSYSHVHDACQYGALAAWRIIEETGGVKQHSRIKKGRYQLSA